MWFFFFFQAEDGIRDLVRSRGLGDVYKRQSQNVHSAAAPNRSAKRTKKALRETTLRNTGVRNLSLIHI